jgi:hypothetical protein
MWFWRRKQVDITAFLLSSTPVDQDQWGFGGEKALILETTG